MQSKSDVIHMRREDKTDVTVMICTNTHAQDCTYIYIYIYIYIYTHTHTHKHAVSLAS